MSLSKLLSVSCLCFFCFFKSSGCNELCVSFDISEITRRSHNEVNEVIQTLWPFRGWDVKGSPINLVSERIDCGGLVCNLIRCFFAAFTSSVDCLRFCTSHGSGTCWIIMVLFFVPWKILWGNKNVDQTHSAAAWHNQILSEQKSYIKMQRWGCSSLILIKEKSSEIYCMWISWSLAGWFLCLGKEKSTTWITKSCNRCTIVALWARDAIMLALLWGWIHVWSRVYLLNRVGVVELPCRMCSVFEKI